MYIFNIFNSVRLRNSIYLHVVLKQERTSLVELKPKCFCLHRMAGTKRLTGELMMIEHFITYYRVPACLLLNNRISAVATTEWPFNIESYPRHSWPVQMRQITIWDTFNHVHCVKDRCSDFLREVLQAIKAATVVK